MFSKYLHYEKNSYKTVIFFFPRANTSGCTKEALEFSGLVEEFKKLNTLIIGISKDSIDQQKKFREKNRKHLSSRVPAMQKETEDALLREINKDLTDLSSLLDRDFSLWDSSNKSKNAAN